MADKEGAKQESGRSRFDYNENALPLQSAGCQCHGIPLDIPLAIRSTGSAPPLKSRRKIASLPPAESKPVQLPARAYEDTTRPLRVKKMPMKMTAAPSSREEVAVSPRSSQAKTTASTGCRLE